MVKCCLYKNCKSTSHNQDEELRFIPFPKPTSEIGIARALKWIDACGRPEFDIADIHTKTYVCSKHFQNGIGPTKEHPFPIKYTSVVTISSPKKRKSIQQPKDKKRRKVVQNSPPEEPVRKRSEKLIKRTSWGKNESQYIRENYLEKMLFTIGKYKLSHLLCDVSLKVSDTNEVFGAHRLMLSAASKFFEELFLDTNATDCNNLVISLPPYCNSDGLAPVLGYIYSGKITIRKSNALNIFKVAWLFKLDEVVEMCRKFCHANSIPQQKIRVTSTHVTKKIHKSTPIETLAKEPPIEPKQPLKEKSQPKQPLKEKSQPKQPLKEKSQPKQPLKEKSQPKIPPCIKPMEKEKSITLKLKEIRPKLLEPVKAPLDLSTNSNQAESVDLSLLSWTPAYLYPEQYLPRPDSPPTPPPHHHLINPGSPVPTENIEASTKTYSCKEPLVNQGEHISISKTVFEHINQMCEENAKSGKSSKVFLIKTGKPVYDMKALVKQSLAIVKHQEQDVALPEISEEVRNELLKEVKESKKRGSQVDQFSRRKYFLE